MGRSAILSNGRLAVGLDEKGHVHDFYYPYVGLDNLTTARSMHHRIGVWVDSAFSWTDSEDWECTAELSADALMAHTRMYSQRLGIEISTIDFVDYEYDCLTRKISVKNTGTGHKSVRIFMHQVFEISRAGRADTALYVPDGNYILDYKGNCSLLISGQLDDLTPFDQFAVGNYGIEGKQGTYRDAEDGELSGHSVEHAGVDSVIRFSFGLNEGMSRTVDYWVAAADSQYDAEQIHAVMRQNFDQRLAANRMHWESWLALSDDRLQAVDEDRRAKIRKSLLTIKAHCDVRGGIIASCDSSIYNYGRDYYSYVWPRDGAYALWPLIRLGYQDEAKQFFNFCADVANEEGYLMHKYQPDQAIGSTWHPLLHGRRSELAIQEDETAILIIMLGEYLNYTGDEAFVKSLYERFAAKAADFLSGYIDEATGLPHASYDLWEEKFLTTTYTTATVYRALLVAAEIADHFNGPGHQSVWRASASSLLEKYPIFINPDRAGFRKGFLLNDTGNLDFDNTLDISSLYGVMSFGYFPKGAQDIAFAVEEYRRSMTADNGGIPRHENDGYFRVDVNSHGNPWPVASLWLAQYFIRINDLDAAKGYIEWVEAATQSGGMLPEQTSPHDNSPVSVTPLVWSHAEYINTVLDLTQKHSAR